jgi:hypothetical protein
MMLIARKIPVLLNAIACLAERVSHINRAVAARKINHPCLYPCVEELSRAVDRYVMPLSMAWTYVTQLSAAMERRP